MAKKKQSVFAIDKDGKDLFIKLRNSGMHPLVVMCDGLSLIHFGNEDRTYLRVLDVIHWHEKELKVSHGSDHGGMMKRPRLRRIDLDRAIPVRKGRCYMTMSTDQWDTTLQAAYDVGFILLEVDEQEEPVRAYLHPTTNAPESVIDN